MAERSFSSAGKLTQIVFGHRDVVTSLARSESYIGGDCYVLSGSRDATLLLWYWNGKLNSIGESPGSKYTVTPAAMCERTHTHTRAGLFSECSLSLADSCDCVIYGLPL